MKRILSVLILIVLLFTVSFNSFAGAVFGGSSEETTPISTQTVGDKITLYEYKDSIAYDMIVKKHSGLIGYRVKRVDESNGDEGNQLMLHLLNNQFPMNCH